MAKRYSPVVSFDGGQLSRRNHEDHILLVPIDGVALEHWRTGGDPQRSTAANGGYDVLDHFALPRAAAWDEYLTPLEARMNHLRPESKGNPTLANVIAETEREIQVFRQFGDAFGYVFYLLRKIGA